MHRFRGFLSAGKRHSRAPHPLAPQQTPAFCHTPTSVPIPAHCICMYRAKTNPAFPHDAHSPLVSAVFAAREYLWFPLSESTKNHLPFFRHFSIFSDTMQTRRKPPAGSSSLQQDTVYLTTLISLQAGLLRRQTGLRGVFSRPVLQDGRQHRDTPHPSRGMQLP